jgi:uncharacterized 2Fe-2S/4Fe-4S cluster protein (DUF4445 family)/ferredoxin
MIRITTHDGRAIALAAENGLSLAQRIFLAGLWEGVPLCAGMGKCGLCRVRYTSPPPPATPAEARRLGPEAAAEGWRLSCLHPASPCDIELPAPKRSARPARRAIETAGGADVSADAPRELAVDLGTTSIHWTALAGGRAVAGGQGLNPQMGLGSEVMSRLGFAAKLGGAAVLANLARERLRDLVLQAEEACGGAVERLCVAGNSAMTCLLLGLPVEGLARAPYRLDYAGGEDRAICPDLPPVRIPPLLSPFVGADLSAGLAALACSANAPRHPYLLADLGTNGEFVLALSPTEHLLASVPMGPALEGVGLRHGRAAAPGAVRAFRVTPAGLAPQHVERPPLPGEDAGVTGVGYLSLAAALLRAGVLDEWGRFVVPATPLGRRIAAGLADDGGETALPIGGGMLLPASDVEELVKVKAAFNLALSRLLAESGLRAADLTAVHLAGAMGEHVDAADLAMLGFLPETLAGRVVRAGNTSLAGAALLLTDPAAWDWVRALPARCRALDLASDPRFGALYVERMVLRHVS